MVRCVELRRRRVALGWTQEELAKVMGLAVRTIIRVESGANRSQVFCVLIDEELKRREESR